MAEPDAEVQAWLSGLSFKLKRELAGKIKEEADGLVAAIQARSRFRTGRQRASVKVRRRRNELDLEVIAGGETTSVALRAGSGEEYDYALAQELGTVDVPADPFFYNTAREMMPDIRENIEQAVADAIAKA